MIVGLTYDLREDYLKEGYSEDETAEFDRPDTIGAIENSLRQLGYRTERIGHARQLAQQLLSGKRWDIVFNIAEGLYGLGRESLVPALLDAYRIPYVFSDPVALGISLHKAFAKQIWRDSGLPTPEFSLVRRVDDIREIDLPFPLFAKPVAEGTGKGVSAESRIENREQLERICRRLLEKYRQPVLVERFLPGREFTVGVLGTGEQAEAIGTLEIILKERAEKAVYSYTNKEYCEELVEYRLLGEPALDREAKELARRAWQALDCRDGGRVDLRADEKGRLQLLEVNPLAGLHPQHSDLPMIATAVGLKYTELIDRIMHSALERYGLQPPR
jgi:D-alanine-D-alanine ligase